MLRDEIEIIVDKIKSATVIDDDCSDYVDKLESLMDDFAVKFAEWCSFNGYMYLRNSNDWMSRGRIISSKELLTEFKTNHYKT